MKPVCNHIYGKLKKYTMWWWKILVNLLLYMFRIFYLFLMSTSTNHVCMLCVCVWIFVCVLCMCVCEFVFMYDVGVSMYTCVSFRVHACACCVCVLVYTYMCTCMCMYVFVYQCVCLVAYCSDYRPVQWDSDPLPENHFGARYGPDTLAIRRLTYRKIQNSYWFVQWRPDDDSILKPRHFMWLSEIFYQYDYL